jgi:hypothetical protein
MTAGQRLTVAGLFGAALLTAAALLIFAANACPSATPAEACPNAALNRAMVVALAALCVALVVAPFAFLAEFAARRRIVYRGAWQRAVRRGALCGAVVAAIGGLRLGDAVSTPVAIFVLLLAGIAEWFAMRRFDAS